MAGGGGGSDGEPEFQIAPMIDVLLVLLIFFMSITTVQVLKVDKEVNLPVSPNADKRDDQRNEAIVNVRWDGDKKVATYVVDNFIYKDMDALTKALQAAKAVGAGKTARGGNQEFRVVIRGDRDAHAIAVAKVLEAAAAAGIVDTTFSATNKEEPRK
jgi:biopolymer transport protein ExbD